MDCYNNQRPVEPRFCQKMPKGLANMDCSCGAPPTTIPPILPRQQSEVMGQREMPPSPMPRISMPSCQMAMDSMTSAPIPPDQIPPCQRPPSEMPPMPPSSMSPSSMSRCQMRPNPLPQRRMPRAPEIGPLAMAYVPCQRWGQTYPIDRAIRRGTIFPDLDLPFKKGRCQR